MSATIADPYSSPDYTGTTATGAIMGHVRLLKGGIVLSTVGAVLLGAAASASAVTGGQLADPQQHPYLAKIQIGTDRACSGALLNAQWALTSRTCFGGATAVPAGTTVSVGTVKLPAQTLVAHPDRDVALVRVRGYVRGVGFASVATAAPAAGGEVTAAGFGRTATEWVPDLAHLGTFAVDTVDATTLGLTGAGDAALCSGDSGGPVLTAGKVVGVATSSGQGGCHGVQSDRRDAVATRVDDLGGWLAANTKCPSVGHSGTAGQQGNSTNLVDYTGDCASDIAGQFSNGDLRVASSTANLTAEFTIFNGPQVARTGFTPSAVGRTVTGDFNGDGRADIGAVLANGEFWFYFSTGNPAGMFTAASAKFGSGWLSSNVRLIIPGDFNGDGVTDIGTQYASGKFIAYLVSRTTPGGTIGSWDAGTQYATGPAPRMFSADLNGDRFSDLIVQYGADKDNKLSAYASNGGIVGGRLFSATEHIQGRGWHAANVERIIFGDVNGDGTEDIGAQYVSGVFQFFLRNRSFGGAGLQKVGTGWYSSNVARIGLGDVNGDSYADVLACYVVNDSANSGDCRFYPSTGNTSGEDTLFKTATRGALRDWNTTAVPRLF